MKKTTPVPLRFLFTTLFLLGIVLAPSAKASNFSGTIGTSYGLGALANSGLGLNSRIMDAFSVEIMPGYRFGSFVIGVDFDYRWEGQLTSLAAAGGNNLRGTGYLLGLGMNYSFSPLFSLQAAVSFVGSYNLAQPTNLGQTGSMNSPLGLRLKAQYFFMELPISFDLDGQILVWRNFTSGSTNQAVSSNQWMLGVGLTYYFNRVFDK